MQNTLNSSQNAEGRTVYWVIALLILAYFPLFLHLESLPLRIWDESLFALRAYHMAETGSYLENFNQFVSGPDHPNVKPPLFSIVQALSFKLFGYNLLALRLPVALCSLATVWLLFRFGIREFGSPVFGFLSALVLLTSRGYVQWHMSRTGDQDAVLALFTTIAILAFYKALKPDPPNGRQLLISAIAITIATLVKSVMGLIILPGLVLYAIYRKQLMPTLRSRHLYYGLAFFFLAVGGTVALLAIRHQEWAGHIWAAELGGRYSNVIDSHAHPFFFYLNIMLRWAFTPWLFLLPFAVWMTFRPSFASFRDLAMLILTVSFSILLVISTSQTKIEWYAASLYPIFALLAGLGIWMVWTSVCEISGSGSITSRTVPAVLLMIAFFYLPYEHIINKVYKSGDYQTAEEYGFFMEKLETDHPEIKDYHIIHHGWNTHTLFYRTVFNDQKGYDIKRTWNANDLQEGDVLMYAQWGVEKQLDTLFHNTEIDRLGSCRLVRIGDVMPKRRP